MLPALIRRFHEAKVAGNSEVTLWGDGSPFREFLHADDLADAAVFLMERYSAAEVGEIVNVGTGRDVTIRELARIIMDVVGYQGKANWDVSKPNGTPRKLLDVGRLAKLGWEATIDLQKGIEMTYGAFLGENRERVGILP